MVKGFSGELQKIQEAISQRAPPGNGGGNDDVKMVDEDERQPKTTKNSAMFGMMLRADENVSRLPTTWRFPIGSISQVWTVWNIGDVQQKFPPLYLLASKDFKFLDGVALLPQEQQRQRGPKSNKRRPSRKTYSDMKFLMDYITKGAKEKGFDVKKDRSATKVHRMFEAISPELYAKTKASTRGENQHKWPTFVFKLRKVLHQEATADGTGVDASGGTNSGSDTRGTNSSRNT